MPIPMYVEVLLDLGTKAFSKIGRMYIIITELVARMINKSHQDNTGLSLTVEELF